jgi:hypothetical protein
MQEAAGFNVDGIWIHPRPAVERDLLARSAGRVRIAVAGVHRQPIDGGIARAGLSAPKKRAGPKPALF